MSHRFLRHNLLQAQQVLQIAASMPNTSFLDFIGIRIF
jgi:hypothetical protein